MRQLRLHMLLLFSMLSFSVLVQVAYVKVGINPIAPFVETNEQTGKSTGMTLDLLALLNKQQQQYNFIPVFICPNRR